MFTKEKPSNIFNKWTVSCSNSPQKIRSERPQAPRRKLELKEVDVPRRMILLLAAWAAEIGPSSAPESWKRPSKNPHTFYDMPVFLLMSARNLYVSTLHWLSKSFVPADMLVVFLSLLVACLLLTGCPCRLGLRQVRAGNANTNVSVFVS